MRQVLLRDEDDRQSIMTIKTDMTNEEIETAIYDEALDENNCDWEEKLMAHAEMLNKTCERVYVDEVLYV